MLLNYYHLLIFNIIFNRNYIYIYIKEIIYINRNNSIFYQNESFKVDLIDFTIKMWTTI